MMRSMMKRGSSSKTGKESAMEVDRMIRRLLGRLGHKPAPLPFGSGELSGLNEEARSVLLKDSMLIQIEPPVKMVGDTHGQFYDVLRMFDFCGDPSKTRYVFLGDYVDRGKLGLELMCLLLALKIKYRSSFWLLRGNHESRPVNEIYGFYDEMRERFGPKRGVRIWEDFCRTFDCLPIAAIVGKRILCMHGELSPDLTSLEQIRKLPRPYDIPDYGLMCDLMWSDPDSPDGWRENGRGISFTFGTEQIKEACDRFDVDMIVRGHQMYANGYKFTAGNRMLTIFSAPNYAESYNSGAVLTVAHDLTCSFEILRPDKTLPLVYRTNQLKKLKMGKA